MKAKNLILVQMLKINEVEMIKLIVISFIAALPLFSASAKADENFGCRAVLCFAGGKGLSECASTISEVKKRLARGKGFPHCSFSDANGKKDLVKQTDAFTRRIGKSTNICPDGTKTNWYKNDGGYRCGAVIVTLKGVNPDGSDQVHEINW